MFALLNMIFHAVLRIPQQSEEWDRRSCCSLVVLLTEQNFCHVINTQEIIISVFPLQFSRSSCVQPSGFR